MIISDLKTKLKTILDALVTAGTLGEVQEDDFKKNIFDRDFAKFPAVVLTSPSIASDAYMNNMNMREHTFNLVVIQKSENISSATDIEDLMENLLNTFDNDPTFGGKADGGVPPSTSQPEPVVAGDKSFVVFGVTVKAKAIKNLTFS